MGKEEERTRESSRLVMSYYIIPCVLQGDRNHSRFSGFFFKKKEGGGL